MLTIFETVVLQKAAKTIVNGIKINITNKKIGNWGRSAVNSSGALAASLRFELTDKGFNVIAYDYIYSLVFGKTPQEVRAQPQKTLYSEIYNWIAQKPLIVDNRAKAASSIVRAMRKNGTTIYQKFGGGNTGLITDVLDDAFIEDLKEELSGAILKEFTDSILDEVGTATI